MTETYIEDLIDIDLIEIDLQMLEQLLLYDYNRVFRSFHKSDRSDISANVVDI